MDVRPRREKRIPTFRDASRDAAANPSLAPAGAGFHSAVFARMGASEVEVEADALDVVNLALLAGGVPLVASLRVRNAGSETLEGTRLRAWVTPEIGETWELALPALAPEEVFEVRDVTPPLDRHVLAARRESGAAHLCIELREHDEAVLAASQPVRVLAGDEWILAPGYEWSLAGFVFPEHATVQRVLGLARVRLERAGFGRVFDGYASGDRGRVRAMAGAVHEALACDLGLADVSLPAGFERTGQRIRRPEELERRGRGTGLDRSLLFAAALERARLAPLLVLVPGHVFAAVWTAEPPAGGPVFRERSLLLEAAVRGGLLAMDAAGCPREASSELAAAAALRHLEQRPLLAAIDVVAARERGARPIPFPNEPFPDERS